MNNTNKILVGLLAAQAVLWGVTWSSDVGRAGASSESRKLIEAEPSAVSAFTVRSRPETEGEAPESVSLTRQGDGWVVAGTDDFPADPKKVDEVLGKLVGATRRAPIATQAANHNALDVGERTYDKKVELTVGGEQKTLVLGSAKGSSVHVRFEGEDDVYLARGISAWAVSDSVDTYVDTQYVDVEEPVEVRVVNSNGPIELQKDDEGNWRVAQLPPDAEVDPSRVRAFVNAARSVRLVAPVGTAVKPEYGLGDGAVQVTVRNAEKTVSYRIGAEDGENHVYVKANDGTHVVKARKFSVESLLKQTPDKFIEEKPIDAPSPMPGMQGLPNIPGLPPGLQMPPPGHGGQ